jgi:hypothetical protein
MGDVEEIAARTLLTARGAVLRVRIGWAARAYVEEHHGVDDVVAGDVALLADLVQSQGGPGPAALTDP